MKLKFPKLKDVSSGQREVGTLLVQYAETHKHLLHRVDAWLDPDTLRMTFQRPLKKPAQAFRIGDVIVYGFWYFPPSCHEMVYLGCGFVAHFTNVEEGSLFSIHSINKMEISKRERLWVLENGGLSRLPRHEIVARAVECLGWYTYDVLHFNCQHIIEEVIGNKSFSIGVVRCVSFGVALVLCVIGLVICIISYFFAAASMASKPLSMRAFGVKGGSLNAYLGPSDLASIKLPSTFAPRYST